MPDHNGQRTTDDGQPESLPPVRPPSAGFLLQLFVVPAIIVAAVIAVWALFGKLAGGDVDWRVLVEEIKSPNKHRRWRGALGLAQMLKADQDRGEAGARLAENEKVAEALCGLLREGLNSRSASEDDLKQQEFLARTLGMIDVPGTVVPVLQEAMRPGHDREVRKNAIASLAMIAGRAAERPDDAPGPDVEELAGFPSLVDDLLAVSADGEPLIRQLAAYSLGLLPSEASRQRLEVMLADSDEKTSVNAAVGLARQDSTAGLEVFRRQLSSAAEQVQRGEGGPPEERDRTMKYFWLAVSLLGVFVTGLWAVFTSSRAARVTAGVACLSAVVTACWQIYTLLESPAPPPAELAAAEGQNDAEQRRNTLARRFEGLMILKNSLKAVGDLHGKLTPQQRTEFAALIEPIAERHSEPRIRVDARRTLQTLRAPAR